MKAGALLALEDVCVGYGDATVLTDVSIEVEAGRVVALLGPNGAGKTTTLRAISGLVPVKRGAILFSGQDTSRLPPHQIVEAGIAHVPEGRRMFPRLSVETNLRLGAHVRRDHDAVEEEIEAFLDEWPVIARRRQSDAGLLSGGEQQIVALGRALLSRPKLLLLDEPSLGLAPVLVSQVYETLHKLVERRSQTILLVEQNAHEALKIADLVCVLRHGRVVARAKAGTISAADIADIYFSADSDPSPPLGELQ